MIVSFSRSWGSLNFQRDGLAGDASAGSPLINETCLWVPGPSGSSWTTVFSVPSQLSSAALLVSIDMDSIRSLGFCMFLQNYGRASSERTLRFHLFSCRIRQTSKINTWHEGPDGAEWPKIESEFQPSSRNTLPQNLMAFKLQVTIIPGITIATPWK